MKESRSTITLTFGDQAENHVGMEKLGEMVGVGEGFNVEDLEAIKERLEGIGVTCVLHHLGEDAYLLVMKQIVDVLLNETGKTKSDLFEEQASLNVDKKVFMYGRVVDKHARWNLCFSEQSHEPDYENRKGRVVGLSQTPITQSLLQTFETWFGPKSQNLKGEGNYYYDIRECGIGFHGDSERRKVIAVRLGASNPIHFHWFVEGKPVGDRMIFELDGGDMYIMSEKTVGTDWKRRKIRTLRHAVGAAKFTKL